MSAGSSYPSQTDAARRRVHLQSFATTPEPRARLLLLLLLLAQRWVGRAMSDADDVHVGALFARSRHVLRNVMMTSRPVNLASLTAAARIRCVAVAVLQLQSMLTNVGAPWRCYLQCRRW